MSDNLQNSFEEIEKDLASSWLDLSSKVRDLAADLKLKAAGTSIANEASHLSQQASRLCDHVERLHTDVIDLLENVETRFPQFAVISPSTIIQSDRLESDEVENEKLQIQRENHQVSTNFKDVIKALFLWKDDPAERVRGHKTE
ncbi:MAG: hypothetical protein H7Y36_06875 [Armatimonadetes bacterium]|nr:hypothetical protein [Akkermansiaceae bacterium]